MKSTLQQLLRFLLVGGLATAIQFLLLAVFVEWDLLPEVMASATAYAIAAIANYLANYHLTFGSNRPHSETLPRFMITAALGLSINTLVFALAFFALNHYLFAQVIATGVTLVCNFLLHKFWIYRR